MTDAIEIKDPMERLKKIVTFYVSVQHVNPVQSSMKAPLNPILGETLHREMDTGEVLYCEQVSHHPPISAYCLYGPNEEYYCYGYHTLKAWLNGGQSMGGSKDGKCDLHFKDGGHYSFKNPTMSIEGLMKTEKT